MKMNKLALAALWLAPLAAIGCGGDTSVTPPSDMAMQIFRIQSGSYSVSNLAAQGTDSCMQNLTSTNFTTLGVTNDGQGHLSLGSNNSSYLSDPTLYTQGTGTFTDSYHVTTMLTDNANSAGCMYHLVRSDTVTVTADNTLNVQYTQTQTAHTGTCTVVAVDCTSAYNFTLNMPVH
jgi:hypothetical protein